MANVNALQGQLHEIRAQNLATLMDAIETITPVLPDSGSTAAQTQRLPQAALTPNLPIAAIVLATPQNGKLMVAIAGAALEIPLSPDLQAEAEANPALFREGARLTLVREAGTSALRLVMPEATTRSAPATLVTMSRLAPGPSAEAAPPLQQVFQPGSPGAGVQRLTGLAFPLAEMPVSAALPRVDALAAGVEPDARAHPNALALPGRQIASALAMLPPQIAEAALYAASRQAPIAPAITALLSGTGTIPAASPTDAAPAEIPSAPLPLRAQAALDALGSSRLDGTAKPDANTINRALQQSGLFLEASLAKGQTPASDLKSLLLTLKSALLPPESAKVEVPASRSQEAQGLRTNDGPRSRENTASNELFRLVEGAVERIKLNQFASLPEHQGMRITDDRPQGFQLSTTIPLATQGLDRPQTAAIGLMIEHQPHAAEIEAYEPDAEGSNEAQGFPWKVRIALDLEEIGPVQAEIGLRGQAVAVTLWAERKGTAALARGEIGALHEALTRAAFEVSRLEVKDGRPMGNVPRFAPALDRRT